MTVSRIYCATGTTGGATGDLDTIKWSALVDKDMAIVMDQTNVLFFNYDEDLSTAESTPWTTSRVIKPDDASTHNGRWVLQSLYIEDLSLVVDDLTVGDDSVFGGDVEIKGAVQIGDADALGANITIYSNTLGDTIVYDATAKTWTFTDIQLVANSVDINGGAIDGTTIGAASPTTIVGTTIDASTDFTIGGTVITDATITDDGTFTIQPTTLTAIKGGGILTVGTLDSVRGEVRIYPAAASNGGYLRIYVAGDSDDSTEYFSFLVTADDLAIGADNDTDMIQLLGGATPSIKFNAGSTFAGTTIADLGTVTTANIDGGTIDNTTIGAGTPSTIVGSTIDAQTDFTIGNTIITDGQITDATGLTLSGAVTFDTVAIGVYPTASNHLATKEYVDQVVNFVSEYYFTDDADAIGGIYKVAQDVPTGAAEGTLSTAGLTEADDQPLYNFITESGVPGITLLEGGTHSIHIHAERTAGNRPTTIYCELYTYAADTTETLLATSEESTAVTSKEGFELHFFLAETVIVATDRLLWKFYANCGVGADTTIALYTEGSNNSHAQVPTSTEVLNSVYVRRDGTTALTGAWSMGNQAVTNVNLDSGVIDNIAIGGSTPAAGAFTTLSSTSNTNLATGAGAVYIGASDTYEGQIYLYADNGTSSPKIFFIVPPDNDDDVTDFRIKINDNSDDFYIGCSADEDMLVFVGGAVPTIQARCAFDVDAALTATTLDADTDFTVGSTVITDGVITDATGFQINTAGGGNVSVVPVNDGGLYVAAAAGTQTYFGVGSDGGPAGWIKIYGRGAGAGGQGGILELYSSDDNDTNIDYYRLYAAGGDLTFSTEHANIMIFNDDGDDTVTIQIVTDWTATGQTCADLGSVTTADINGGTIDGATIASCTIGSNSMGDAALTTIDAAPAGDTTATGTVVAATVDTNAAGYGGIVYLNSGDGHWDTADKDAEATAGKLVAMALGTTGAINILLHGVARQDTWDWTAGAPVYIGDDGALTADVSGYTTGDIIRLVGYALTADTVYFNPSFDFFEVA